MARAKPQEEGFANSCAHHGKLTTVIIIVSSPVEGFTTKGGAISPPHSAKPSTHENPRRPAPCSISPMPAKPSTHEVR